MQALYLDIENAVGVDGCALVLCDVLGECGFLRGLYAAEPVKLSGVAGVFLKFFQAGEVGYPAFAAEKVGDLRVIPFVLFWKRSGYSSYHSGSALCLSISVWIRATPLVQLEQ